MGIRSKSVAVAATTVSALGALMLAGAVPLPAFAADAPKGTACSTTPAVKSATMKYSTEPELGDLQHLLPFIDKWQRAVAAKDAKAAKTAGINYEVAWQGAEVYLNHRSIVVYTDLEPNNQFVLEDLQEEANPDWAKACTIVKRMGRDLETAMYLSSSGPRLPKAFDDLAKVRHVRAYLNQARDALTAGDLPTAKTWIAKFNAGWPSVTQYINSRSTTAVSEINALYQPVADAIAAPGATAASVNTPFVVWQSRVGYGVNLINAAARAGDPKHTSFTDVDKTNLTNLNNVWLAIKNSQSKLGTPEASQAVAAASTGAGSAFQKVTAALEVQQRYISVAPALRNALNAYATLAAKPTPTQSEITTAVNNIKDQIAIDQQYFVGIIWSDPAVASYIAGLPTS